MGPTAFLKTINETAQQMGCVLNEEKIMKGMFVDSQLSTSYFSAELAVCANEDTNSSN